MLRSSEIDVVQEPTSAQAVDQPVDMIVEPADVGWGRLPDLALSSALALLVVACAYTAARLSLPWANALSWLGLLGIITPSAARLLSPQPSRIERLGLVLIVGAAYYGVKLAHSPLGFTYADELKTLRTVADIAATGQLFLPNPALPIISYYPGLPIITALFAQISGLSLEQAGMIIIGAARLLMIAGLFLFYERASGSARIAGLGTLLYAGNPSFLFFNAQFAYESLALPLAVITLYALVRRGPPGEPGRLLFSLLAISCLGALVITHHMTSYALIVFLVLLAAIVALLRQAPGQDGVTRGFTVLAVVGASAWLVYAAVLTVGYITPVLKHAVVEVVRLIFQEGEGRELFRSNDGTTEPLAERVVMIATVLGLLAGMPIGLRAFWRQYRGQALPLALAVGALAYPASLAMRLTKAGQETSGRTSAFIFLALSFVLALAALALSGPRPTRLRTTLLTGWISLLLLGGPIIGWATWLRLPGPYLVAADTRSIEPQGMAAAGWARSYLGPNNQILADRINYLLMSSRGGQFPLTGLKARPLYPIAFATTLDAPAVALLRAAGVRYLVIDQRLTTTLPKLGIYFENSEPGAYQHTSPLPRAAVTKYDAAPELRRVFDSGDIAIYDTGAPSHE